MNSEKDSPTHLANPHPQSLLATAARPIPPEPSGQSARLEVMNSQEGRPIYSPTPLPTPLLLLGHHNIVAIEHTFHTWINVNWQTLAIVVQWPLGLSN